MTKEQIEAYKRVFEEDAKWRQEIDKKNRQEAINRQKEGMSLAGDYVYFQGEKKDEIAHQNEKIAHPDTMNKVSATILLIVGMIGSLIFKQWYFAWAILLFWYFKNDRV